MQDNIETKLSTIGMKIDILESLTKLTFEKIICRDSSYNDLENLICLINNRINDLNIHFGEIEEMLKL